MKRSRRGFLRDAFLVAASVPRRLPASPLPAAKRKLPNIVLILADDLGYGDVGCYNPESKVPTPNLDHLAREGIRFTDAHSPSTVCTPTRYSLLTGQMPFRAGVRNVFVGSGGPCLIKEGQLTLPRMLRERGYATAMTGKWHVGLSFFDAKGETITRGDLDSVKRIDFTRAIPDAPIHRGFDRFFGTACCPGTDTLYAFIIGDRIPVPPTQLLDKSKLPKHPYAGDNRMGMIAPDYDIEEVDMVFLQKSQEFLEDHVKRQPDKPFFLYHATAAVHLPSFAARQFRGTTKAGPHGDYIHEFDFIVGELMDTLDELGVSDNTLVMLSSDNGPEVTSVLHMRADYGHDGARPWRGMKRDDWEGGHRVPFIVRWPGKVKPGSASAQTVSLTDVMATCAAVSGAKIPASVAQDSVSLLPALLGEDGGKSIRDHTLQQALGQAMSIRQGPWKYLDHRGSGGNNYEQGELKPFALPDTALGAPGQLYNLADDPGETNNLYLKHPEIAQRLKSLLETSKAQGRSTPGAQLQSDAAINLWKTANPPGKERE
jgi:arylsulfatase A-like enzyme